ncbi:MAG: IPExxxVDY family protein [Bacteroidota bacterium]
MAFFKKTELAIKKLSIDDDYDFSLVGISSHSKDYRLCWSVNNQLGTAFVKKEDLKVELVKSHEISLFSFYEHEDEENFNMQYIIANNGTSGMLLPEHRNLDYFWMIKGNFTKQNMRDLLEKLSKVEAVITCLEMDVATLKSKQNLIF